MGTRASCSGHCGPYSFKTERGPRGPIGSMRPGSCIYCGGMKIIVANAYIEAPDIKVLK